MTEAAPTTTPPSPLRIEVVTPAPPASEAGSSKLEWLKSMTEFVKAAAWPFVILSFAVWLRGPIRSAVELLPDKLRAADKVSVFSFSFEVQRKAAAKGDSRIWPALRSVSPEAIEELMELGRAGGRGLIYTNTGRNGGEYSAPSVKELAALEELERAGLIALSRRSGNAPMANGIREFRDRLAALPGLRVNDGDAQTTWYFPPSPQAEALRELHYSATELGREAFDTIIEVVGEQLRESQSTPPASK